MPFDATDPDTKAAIDAIKSEFNDKLETEAAKNRGLLDDFKKAQAALRAKDGVDPADLAKAEARIDELTGKLTTAEKDAKAAQKAAETATKALETEQGFTHRLVAENGLMKALSDNGVSDPAYLEAAKAMHIGAVKIVAEGDARKAMYGDKELAAAMKEWAAGDVGKKFVAAPLNGGGGAQGGGGSGGGAKTVTRTQFNALDPAGQMAFAKDGGKVVDQAA